MAKRPKWMFPSRKGWKAHQAAEKAEEENAAAVKPGHLDEPIKKAEPDASPADDAADLLTAGLQVEAAAAAADMEHAQDVVEELEEVQDVVDAAGGDVGRLGGLDEMGRDGLGGLERDGGLGADVPQRDGGLLGSLDDPGSGIDLGMADSRPGPATGGAGDLTSRLKGDGVPSPGGDSRLMADDKKDAGGDQGTTKEQDKKEQDKKEQDKKGDQSSSGDQQDKGQKATVTVDEDDKATASSDDAGSTVVVTNEDGTTSVSQVYTRDGVEGVYAAVVDSEGEVVSEEGTPDPAYGRSTPDPNDDDAALGGPHAGESIGRPEIGGRVAQSLGPGSLMQPPDDGPVDDRPPSLESFDRAAADGGLDPYIRPRDDENVVGTADDVPGPGDVDVAGGLIDPGGDEFGTGDDDWGRLRGVGPDSGEPGEPGSPEPEDDDFDA